MYIVKGTEMHRNDFAKKIIADLTRMEKEEYYTPKQKRSFRLALANMVDIKAMGLQLHELNHALLKGRDVFAVCDKYPANLDRGRHYFSVFYVNGKGQAEKIWVADEGLRYLIRMDRQDRDQGIPRYGFQSGCIGMSRVLDATDGLFSYIKSCTGTYAQINCK
jgi:hypothetical protein